MSYSMIRSVRVLLLGCRPLAGKHPRARPMHLAYHGRCGLEQSASEMWMQCVWRGVWCVAKIKLFVRLGLGLAASIHTTLEYKRTFPWELI